MNHSWKLLQMICMTLILLIMGACGTTNDGEDGQDMTNHKEEVKIAKIAFVSDRDGNNEIYVMNSDGSGQINLTNHKSMDNVPAMSPDGEKIAFCSMRYEPYPEGCEKAGTCNSELFVINIDGTGLIRLTDMPGAETFPSWSPDGSKIAFQSNLNKQEDIYLINNDGSNLTNLTNDKEWDLYPTWKPDDPQVVFLSVRNGFQFRAVNIQGTGLKVLDKGESFDNSDVLALMFTEDYNMYIVFSDDIKSYSEYNLALGEFPSWSPDGTCIAFHSRRGGGDREIYVMNSDLSGLVQLTDNEAEDLFPVWSPDGSKIAFQTDRDGNYEIYVMNSDGSGSKNLTNNPADDSLPAWYP